MTAKTCPRWQPDEIARLRSLILTETGTEFYDAFPGRSRNAVANKVHQLGMRRRQGPPDPWSWHKMGKVGVKIGNLRESLGPDLRSKLADLAAKRGGTICDAIAEVIERVL